MSPLRNRPASVDPAQFTPSKTSSLCVSYGTPAFKRRFCGRSDSNMPLQSNLPHLRCMVDSQLLKQNRDSPGIDERRVLRAPNLSPLDSLGRRVGLNGEMLDEEPRRKISSEITKFVSRSIDPHAITQAMLRQSCHRKIQVEDSFSGSNIKAQLSKATCSSSSPLVPGGTSINRLPPESIQPVQKQKDSKEVPSALKGSPMIPLHLRAIYNEETAAAAKEADKYAFRPKELPKGYHGPRPAPWGIQQEFSIRKAAHGECGRQVL